MFARELVVTRKSPSYADEEFVESDVEDKAFIESHVEEEFIESRV